MTHLNARAPHLALLASALGGVAVLVSGCANTQEPTEAEYDEIARGVAPLVAQELTVNLDAAVAAAEGAPPLWLSVDAEGHLGGNSGDLHVGLALACYDSADAALAECSEATTRATLDAEASGALVLGGWSGMIDTEGHWALDGLDGTSPVTATGTTHVSAESTFTGILLPIERHYDFTFDGSYDVTFQRGDPRATTGEATAMVSASRYAAGPNRESEAHFMVEMRVTFDGSGHATVMLDGQASYDVDLATGATTRN